MSCKLWVVLDHENQNQIHFTFSADHNTTCNQNPLSSFRDITCRQMGIITP